MRHVALPRLWRERKELSVSGACGLPSMARQYAPVEIKRGVYRPRYQRSVVRPNCPPRVNRVALTARRSLPVFPD